MQLICCAACEKADIPELLKKCYQEVEHTSLPHAASKRKAFSWHGLGARSTAATVEAPESQDGGRPGKRP